MHYKKATFIVLFLGLVALAGIWFYSRTIDKSQKGWEKFSNQIVEFEYPSNWDIETSEFKEKPRGFGVYFTESKKPRGGFTFSVRSDFQADYTLENSAGPLERALSGDLKITNKQNLVIDGSRAIRYDAEPVSNDKHDYRSNVDIDSGVYLVSGQVYSSEKSIIETAHQIYDSLKFKEGGKTPESARESSRNNTSEVSSSPQPQKQAEEKTRIFPQTVTVISLNGGELWRMGETSQKDSLEI